VGKKSGGIADVISNLKRWFPWRHDVIKKLDEEALKNVPPPALLDISTAGSDFPGWRYQKTGLEKSLTHTVNSFLTLEWEPPIVDKKLVASEANHVEPQGQETSRRSNDESSKASSEVCNREQGEDGSAAQQQSSSHHEHPEVEDVVGQPDELEPRTVQDNAQRNEQNVERLLEHPFLAVRQITAQPVLQGLAVPPRPSPQDNSDAILETGARDDIPTETAAGKQRSERQLLAKKRVRRRLRQRQPPKEKVVKELSVETVAST
jgi:hypothetical protein